MNKSPLPPFSKGGMRDYKLRIKSKIANILVAFQIGDFKTKEPFNPIPTSILPLKGRKLIFLSIRERIKVRVGSRFNIRSPIFYAANIFIPIS